MRKPAPHRPPVALTIAGSDSGGGAGIQADLKTMEAHGAFGTSVLTAVTAQNTRGVHGSHVLPIEEIRGQLDAVTDDFDVRAAKTGMLATRPVIELVTEFAAAFDAPLVVDPVMVAATGDRLLEPEAEAAYEDLASHATVLTPNVDEAEVLTGREVDDVAAAEAAGRDLVDLGADAALVKGGHLGGEAVDDVLVTPEGDDEMGREWPDESDREGDRERSERGDQEMGGKEVRRFTHPRVDTDATHGSGCALASAIAARLARGEPLEAAVEHGVDFMARAVRYHLDVGEGPGSVHHLSAIRERAARDRTAEAVAGLVERLVDLDVSPLVPEVGTNVAGATPFAEHQGEVAAVDGRIQRTMAGMRPGGGVRFGASGHVARFLLGVREFVPDRRFACNCRFDDDVEAALAVLDWPVAAVDRGAQPGGVAGQEGSTMEWAARQAFSGAGEPPVAVFDRGAVGKERMCRLVARDAATLGDRLAALLDAL